MAHLHRQLRSPPSRHPLLSLACACLALLCTYYGLMQGAPAALHALSAAGYSGPVLVRAALLCVFFCFLYLSFFFMVLVRAALLCGFATWSMQDLCEKAHEASAQFYSGFRISHLCVFV